MDDGRGWSYLTETAYKSATTLVHYLIDNVSKNGYLLLNVGPKPNGEIPEQATALLTEIGRWLAINGEAIYGTRGGPIPPRGWLQIVNFVLAGALYVGGAAGQHACLVADALAMTRVFIHPLAGVLSAYGMGLADQVAMRSRAVEAPLGGCELEEFAEAVAHQKVLGPAAGGLHVAPEQFGADHDVVADAEQVVVADRERLDEDAAASPRSPPKARTVKQARRRAASARNRATT